MKIRMRTILLIEDEKTLRESIREILTFEGYKVLETDNGAEAVAIALDRVPDLILCDIMLPGLNGFEVFREVKKNKEMLFTPFIFLTALSNENDIRYGMGLGADDYVTKPFKRDALVKTIRARLEKLTEIDRQEEYAAELLSINQDLEEVGQFISHELKHPLMILGMFSQLLLDEYSENLDEKGREYIQTIHAHVREMRMRVDGLLSLAAHRGSKITRSMVPLGLLAASVIADLKAFGPPNPVAFKIGNLPDAWCNELMIRQVLANLISNAVKYSSRKKDPAVEVGAALMDGETVYFVRDNGIGFDMNRASDLFHVFRRLNSESQYDGIGLGLAIVKLIIDKHGGRVWAESAPDRGAAFFFTLPPD